MNSATPSPPSPRQEQEQEQEAITGLLRVGERLLTVSFKNQQEFGVFLADHLVEDRADNRVATSDDDDEENRGFPPGSDVYTVNAKEEERTNKQTNKQTKSSS
jgi:hypothetical protein